MAHPANYWRPHTNPERIVCEVCPRECTLRAGQRGFCFTRMNQDGALTLDGYGRVIGLCADPIEKKPLNHFYPGSGVMSFGTAGCNLGCKFCQNWSMSKTKNLARASTYVAPEIIPAIARDYHCRSVAFTYNDPVIFIEYAIDVAQACRAMDIKTVAVTAGYIQGQARADFFAAMDGANIDLKGFSEKFYDQQCLARLAPVLDTLQYVKHETACWLEVTTLLIPGVNDSAAELRAQCEWFMAHLGADTPLHFTAFHPDFKMKNRGRTPHETLLTARAIAHDTGLRYVYVGNVHDRAAGSTHCPGCTALLIERDWYQLGTYTLADNHCAQCNAVIPGRFAANGKGTFGAQRVPVR